MKIMCFGKKLRASLSSLEMFIYMGHLWLDFLAISYYCIVVYSGLLF